MEIVKSKMPHQLQKEGFGFVKLKPRTKIPFEKDWQNHPYSYEEIKSWVEQGGNYGVQGGFGNATAAKAAFILIVSQYFNTKRFQSSGKCAAGIAVANNAYSFPH